MSNVGLILLAAGASSRLGQPKQLLQFRGRSLLRHAAKTALQSICRPVLVVLAGDFESELRDLTVQIIHNPQPDEGIASSIRTGINALPTDIDGAVVCLADQPFVTSDILNALANSKSLAAAFYNNSIGVPAFFPRRFFPELLALQGDKGARSILAKHSALAIPCPTAAIDIDTLNDVIKLND